MRLKYFSVSRSKMATYGFERTIMAAKAMIF